MKKQNNSGFSIIIAILLVVVMTLLVLYILEYIIPYSKNVKGIENSSNAFYQSESGIEDGLFFFKKRSIDIENNVSGVNLKTENSDPLIPSDSVDGSFNTFSSGSTIPPTGEGNSEFDIDKNFNTISVGNPIQLEVGGLINTDWNGIEFKFRTPFIGGSRGSLDGGNIAVINWQLSGINDTLNAEGSWILASDIPSTGFSEIMFNGSTNNASSINYDEGQILAGTPRDFQTFYNNNCSGTDSCILKMSVINELKTTGQSLPYLEYRIDFGNDVALRYSRIKAKGKSYGFQKFLEVRVPQQTTNEAFDFTVFQ